VHTQKKKLKKENKRKTKNICRILRGFFFFSPFLFVKENFGLNKKKKDSEIITHVSFFSFFLLLRLPWKTRELRNSQAVFFPGAVRRSSSLKRRHCWLTAKITNEKGA
jgi:hypothetical protein